MLCGTWCNIKSGLMSPLLRNWSTFTSVHPYKKYQKAHFFSPFKVYNGRGKRTWKWSFCIITQNRDLCTVLGCHVSWCIYTCKPGHWILPKQVCWRAQMASVRGQAAWRLLLHYWQLSRACGPGCFPASLGGSQGATQVVPDEQQGFQVQSCRPAGELPSFLYRVPKLRS